MMPVYIKYIGSEAYGLVGFFAMLQAWFQLLDLGLTPTIAREAARHHAGAINASSLRQLLRALEIVFVGVALLGAAGIISLSDLIATEWLNVEILQVDQVRISIMLMGIIIGLRWTSGLYRGIIIGFEKLVWLGNWNAIVSTLRFVMVVPFFIYIGTSPVEFFTYQLGVALLELTAFLAYAYRLIPKLEATQRTSGLLQPLHGVLKFSLSIAFTSSVWVLVTQTDKLLLSKLLPLAEYSYFTIAVLVSGGVMMVSGPISAAIMPRMTRLQASGAEGELIKTYRNATQFVAVVSLPTAFVLAFFPEQVLWAWTGDALLAAKAAPVLMLYALGSSILAFGAFPYYLQYAKGDLKLHMIGNLIFVFLLIPSLIWATLQFGMIGAGWAWLTSNLIYFILWVPLVHKCFARGLHWPWLIGDIISIGAPVSIVALLLYQVLFWPTERLAVTVQVCVIAILLLGVACLSSDNVRTHLFRYLQLRLVKR